MNIEEAKRILALYFSHGQTDVLFGRWDTDIYGGDAVLFMNTVSTGQNGAIYLVRNGQIGIVNLSINTIEEIYELLETPSTTSPPNNFVAPA